MKKQFLQAAGWIVFGVVMLFCAKSAFMDGQVTSGILMLCGVGGGLKLVQLSFQSDKPNVTRESQVGTAMKPCYQKKVGGVVDYRC